MRAIRPQRAGISSPVARARPAAAASPLAPISLAPCSPSACCTRGAHAAPLARGAALVCNESVESSYHQGLHRRVSLRCARLTDFVSVQLRFTCVLRARARPRRARLCTQKNMHSRLRAPLNCGAATCVWVLKAVPKYAGGGGIKAFVCCYHPEAPYPSLLGSNPSIKILEPKMHNWRSHCRTHVSLRSRAA